jgi:uncharacterized Zn finger protein (UPF0148 family)
MDGVKPKSSREDMQRAAELMLGGWKMLAQHCPICNFPLYSKGDAMRCAGCNLDVARESEVHFMDSEEKTETLVNSNDISTPLVINANIHRKKLDESSAKLGQRMLQGWTLLGSICPQPECRGTPLMSLRGSNMICVNCENEYELKTGAIVTLKKESCANTKNMTLQSTNSNPSTLPPLVDLSQAPVLSPSLLSSSTTPNFNDEDSSMKISKKMLQGYCLLEKLCPICKIVPLVRSNDNIEICVECDDKNDAFKLPRKIKKMKNSSINAITDMDNDMEIYNLDEEGFEIQLARNNSKPILSSDYDSSYSQSKPIETNITKKLSKENVRETASSVFLKVILAYYRYD